VLKFRRDINGKLDLNNGTYSEEEVTQMKCKYTDEIHMCLGAGVVTPLKDRVKQEQEGQRCEPFVYSAKTLLSIPWL